jgi:hypothetical protein
MVVWQKTTTAIAIVWLETRRIRLQKREATQEFFAPYLFAKSSHIAARTAARQWRR